MKRKGEGFEKKWVRVQWTKVKRKEIKWKNVYEKMKKKTGNSETKRIKNERTIKIKREEEAWNEVSQRAQGWNGERKWIKWKKVYTIEKLKYGNWQIKRKKNKDGGEWF